MSSQEDQVSSHVHPAIRPQDRPSVIVAGLMMGVASLLIIIELVVGGGPDHTHNRTILLGILAVLALFASTVAFTIEMSINTANTCSLAITRGVMAAFIALFSLATLMQGFVSTVNTGHWF